MDPTTPPYRIRLARADDLEPAEWSAGMKAIRDHEARHGIRVEARRPHRTKILRGEGQVVEVAR